MNKIYKYTFGVQDELLATMPTGAIIRHIGTQDGCIVIWAEVNPGNVVEVREFHVSGTGYAIPEYTDAALIYIGTVMIDVFVWHIYEKVAHVPT